MAGATRANFLIRGVLGVAPGIANGGGGYAIAEFPELALGAPETAKTEHRLLQDDSYDAGPEPWRVAFHPGAECLLAGLVNIVPELAKPGETQGLIGHPTRPVIDHEHKPAGQQQQAQKSKKTADHASPY